MSRYSELLKVYKSKRDELNPEYVISGSGCFFHSLEEFEQFSDVDDDKIHSLEAVF